MFGRIDGTALWTRLAIKLCCPQPYSVRVFNLKTLGLTFSRFCSNETRGDVRAGSVSVVQRS